MAESQSLIFTKLDCCLKIIDLTSFLHQMPNLLNDNIEPTPFGIATLSGNKAVVYLQQWLNPAFESLHELNVVVSLGSLATTRRNTQKINYERAGGKSI
ncbi:hypothetical protein ACTXT7_011297 [Hymenolepis weldensis]